MEIIRKLDYLKKRDKLTIRQIAERTGIPVGTLNKIFCGATKNPSVQVVEKLAAVFKVPVRYLIRDDIDVEFEVGACADHESLLNISKQESQLLNSFRCLSEREKCMAEAMLASFLEIKRRKGASGTSRQLFCYIPRSWGQYGVSADSLMVKRVSVEEDPISREADFAVLNWSRGLEPVYQEGAVLAVKRGTVRHNQLVVFVLNGEGYVRIYQQARGRRRLMTINRNIMNITLTERDELRCLGLVLGAVRLAEN